MTVDGYVVTADDHTPVAGAPVYIIWYNDFKSFEAAATHADDRGHYLMTFKGVCSPKEGIPTYHVKAVAAQPGYLFATESLECKDRQTVNIYIKPFEPPTVTAG